MFKKWSIFLLVILLWIIITIVAATGIHAAVEYFELYRVNTSVIINGTEKQFNNPILRYGDGTTYVPYREFVEALGCDIWWQDGKIYSRTPTYTSSVEKVYSNCQKFNVDMLLEYDYLATGVAIGNGLVVTNKHVVEKCKNIFIRYDTPERGDLNPIGDIVKDDRYDLAICKTKIPLPTNKLGDSDHIRTGEKVVVIGNPHNERNTVSEGIITGFRYGDNGTKYIKTSAYIDFGNSGSGLYNMDGELIGVMSFFENNDKQVSCAVPVNAIKNKLKEIQNDN